jgi:hypothetical protein
VRASRQPCLAGVTLEISRATHAQG